MPQIVRDQFERELEKYFRVKHAIAVNSGTSALIATLCSMDLNGGEVITTPFTFVEPQLPKKPEPFCQYTCSEDAAI
jgi:dTDP-4-amino-4,6-dideoxygalactose transaminase